MRSVSNVEDPEHVGLVEPSHQHRFLLESREGGRILALRGEDLDRNGDPEPRVLREIDLRNPASSDSFQGLDAMVEAIDTSMVCRFHERLSCGLSVSGLVWSHGPINGHQSLSLCPA